MKRIIVLILTLIFAFGGVVFASSTYKGYKTVNVQYEGKTVVPSDVPAIMLDGRTMVPLDMLRKIGFDVGWDGATATANITPKKEPSAPKKVLTKEQIQALDDRIALIYALDEYGIRKEQGSGFLLNPSGLLITADHVLTEDGQDRALEVHVRGKIYKVPAGVTAFRDADKDVAGVYLYDKEPFPYLKVGELPEVGDKVYALGNPKGERNVLTEGKVKFTANKKIFDDTLGKPGASGGSLINQYGQVIGVIIQGDNNVGVSVQIEEVMKLYQDSFNN